jgi:hypothetical protein
MTAGRLAVAEARQLAMTCASLLHFERRTDNHSPEKDVMVVSKEPGRKRGWVP